MNTLVIVISFCLLTRCISQRDFTIAVIPDTQYYSAYYQEMFFEQTTWICKCAEKKNIVYTSHVGDIVEHGNKIAHEWNIAKSALNKLSKCNMPTGILPGNHDMGREDPDTKGKYHLYTKTFPMSLYMDKHKIRGSFKNTDLRSSYSLITINGNMELIFINLEFLFSRDVIKWASDLLLEYRNRTAIISSHYIGTDCSQDLDNDLVALAINNCNILLLFGGHDFFCGGEMTTQVKNKCNTAAYFLVSDYQGRIKGGLGWLRYYTFQKESNFTSICAYTYSPFLKEYELDSNSYFSMNLINNTIGPGCQIKECRNIYATEGYILAFIGIFAINAMYFIYLLLL